MRNSVMEAKPDSDTDDTPLFVDLALFDGIMLRRVIAYAIDVLLLAVLGGIAALFLGFLGLLTFGLISPLSVFLLALLPVLYHAGLMTAYGGTPGMSICDLTVRSVLDGRPPEALQATIMTVLFFLSVAATGWLILIVALFNQRRRTMHDYFSGTIVLRRSRLDTEASL